ncbi:hypothetical protein LPC08_06695 [Roseomonas sp. OT10]|uniref:hypothetical protein n=1 Tax=Roseomonas cutis TaxID=2897332 RepID=UPI001E5C5027|nr:hypothetical protein [Roseomonas sp. OT10]UFN50308.1 hypothetical protein LPC08_06695 [Roseomonas sp. OT10]
MTAPVGLTVRHSPLTGLLQIGFRLETPAAPGTLGGEFRALGASPSGVAPANATLELVRHAPGWLRVEATAMLPPHLPIDTLRLLLTRDGAPFLSVAPSPALREESAPATLEPAQGGVRATAWAMPGVRPGLRVDNRTEALHRLASGLWHTLLPAPPHRLAVTTPGDPGLVTNPLEGWLSPTPHDPRLDALRGRHAGETAWLVGNGPSVRMEDLEALRGRLCFGFNRLHLAYDRSGFRPTHTVSGDPQMIRDFGARIAAEAGGTVFLAAPERPDLPGDWIWLRQEAVWPPLFSLDPRRVVGAGGSSLFVAMQLGWWMGVRRFLLYGVDFAFADAAPGADGLARGDGNHFIPGYRDGRPWVPPSWRDICAAFLLARRLAESEGGWLRNATRGGRLDWLPREDFAVAVQSHAAPGRDFRHI